MDEQNGGPLSGSAGETARSHAYYGGAIESFVHATETEILGKLALDGEFDLALTQRDAWIVEITSLQYALASYVGRGGIWLEFSVPRLGKRIDAVVIVDHLLFVLEFKVGEEVFAKSAIEQVWDYALDLKYFHETSREVMIVPILIATKAIGGQLTQFSWSPDGVARPIRSSVQELPALMRRLLSESNGSKVVWYEWERGRYFPTPTIIEAAKALYNQHSVAALARRDASARNLAKSSRAISDLIRSAKAGGKKAICFVTGVPGAGKTLVGLDVATRHMDPKSELHSVYLSGNGPLVKILQEALARDALAQGVAKGEVLRKGEARQKVQAFIQNVHHFRDDCLKNLAPPPEHVAIFDEAQRAWNMEKTADFMARKKGLSNFSESEPSFLISCLERHADWAVVVCLVGGGQEINTGEAGISEWITAIQTKFEKWMIHISPQLNDTEYAAAEALKSFPTNRLVLNDDLHLSVSMRSFRAERLSSFVKSVLDLESPAAVELLRDISKRYPVCLTRDLSRAKAWLRSRARGSERFGIVASSQAQRLRPHAIHVKAPMDPIHWFLDDESDIRSSFYLEDVATEFDVQGLELDWTCVVWDGDFRHVNGEWQYHSFVGSRWNRILKGDRQTYLKNAYRVLLTRARQGMVLVVPEGSIEDRTRAPEFYDGTYEYLRGLGLPLI